MPVQITRHIDSSDAVLSVLHLQKTAEKLLHELNVSEFAVGIVLTDDEEIRAFNRDYRGKDSPTNVLSFAFSESTEDDLPPLDVPELGDIIISLDTAQREARQLKTNVFRRLDWLVTHGLLHLLGYDHERSAADAEKMHNRELELLNITANYRSNTMPQLAINVDHVATVRQARGGDGPDPVTAASICEIAGASGIVIHLREDRRHIQDKDVYLLRKTVKTKLNLEMGANREIIDIALDVVPDMITLVPEKRQELTTEGGLDVLSQKKKLAKVIKKFAKASIPVSIFVDPDFDQIRASHDIGAKYVEIHTGRYCDAQTEDQTESEFELIAAASQEAHSLGLIVNGGHGLDYHNTGRIAALDVMDELSIGHAVISRAIFTGLDTAVRDMLNIIRNAQLQLY